MSQTRQEPNLSRWVHGTLLLGMVLSGVLLILGLVLVFIRHQPRPEGPPPVLGTLLRGVLAGNGLSIIDLALVVLMLTPLFRVAVLAFGWTLVGQRRFAVVAFVVLGLLLLSLAFGVG
jgi:uncharacterized membrane protein